MSTNPASSNSLLSSSKPSLADVRACILADQTLSEERRRDMASALVSLAKALGRPADIIEATPLNLRPLLDGLTPAMVGKSPGRWRNILSLSNASLAHVGLVVVQGRIRAAPSVAWQSVIDLTQAKSSARYHLSRFGRYATQKGMSPSDVSDATIALYEQDLTTASLVEDPKRSAREAARAWNAASDRHPSWPHARLAIPDNRKIFSLSWAALPSTLKDDIDAWLAWLANDDLHCGRPSAPLRAASIATRQRQIRALIGALVLEGVDSRSLIDLKAVVTLTNVKLAMTHFHIKAGKVGTAHLHQLAGVFVMIARHWVKLEPKEIAAIQIIANKVRPKSLGMTQRNIVRLQAVEDPKRLLSLLNLPQQLLLLARRSPEPSRHTALIVQTAVMVEILLHLPLRLGNLRDLRIGREFLRTNEEKFAVIRSPYHVKNSVRIDVTLSKEVSELVDIYIERYRPLLAERGDWLFPGRSADAPKCAEAVRSQLADAIATHCGLVFTPHLFRHLAAWLILRENPDAHGQVQRVLAHKSLYSTMAYYSGLETNAAVEHFDAIVRASRDQVAGGKSRLLSKGGR